MTHAPFPPRPNLFCRSDAIPTWRSQMRDELRARPRVLVFDCLSSSFLARHLGPWALGDFAGGGIHHCNLPKVCVKITPDNECRLVPFLCVFADQPLRNLPGCDEPQMAFRHWSAVAQWFHPAVTTNSGRRVPYDFCGRF